MNEQGGNLRQRLYARAAQVAHGCRLDECGGERTMKRLEQIGRGNLSTKVYQQLRAALMSGLYEPGQRLLIIDLAE